MFPCDYGLHDTRQVYCSVIPAAGCAASRLFTSGGLRTESFPFFFRITASSASVSHWSIRVRRQIQLALLGLAIAFVVFLLTADRSSLARLSMAAAYAGLALLSLSLIIGPLNTLRGRRAPVSNYLRRDIGILAGIFAIVHTVIGLKVHLQGDFIRYFIYECPDIYVLPIRYDAFGIANHTGLLAAVIFLVLLGISNNASLRALGPRRWKSVQRWNYAGAMLVLFHGMLYQLIENRTLGFVIIFVGAATPAAIMQFMGYKQRRSQLEKI